MRAVRKLIWKNLGSAAYTNSHSLAKNLCPHGTRVTCRDAFTAYSPNVSNTYS